MKTFDPTKPCQTQDGRPVQILLKNGPNPAYPIVGFIINEIHINTWDNDGRFNTGYESNCDLINIPEPPKLRPWKPEEVPVGALVRGTNLPGAFNAMMIIENCAISVKIIRSGHIDEILHSELPAFHYSLDHGKTWHPCGVLE